MISPHVLEIKAIGLTFKHHDRCIPPTKQAHSCLAPAQVRPTKHGHISRAEPRRA